MPKTEPSKSWHIYLVKAFIRFTAKKLLQFLIKITPPNTMSNNWWMFEICQVVFVTAQVFWQENIGPIAFIQKTMLFVAQCTELHWSKGQEVLWWQCDGLFVQLHDHTHPPYVMTTTNFTKSWCLQIRSLLKFCQQMRIFTHRLSNHILDNQPKYITRSSRQRTTIIQ